MSIAEISTTQTNSTTALRVTIAGSVQGLGVRPAIRRWAMSLGLKGSVRNASNGVVVEIEGSKAATDRFLIGLRDRIPKTAAVAAVEVDRQSPKGCDGFAIEAADRAGPLRTPVPPDRSICEACLADVRNGSERRRHWYPFVSCSECGPRYSVISAMPYERQATTLRRFPFCGACREEYESMQDRRHNAETTTCADCGPRLWMIDAWGGSLGGDWRQVVRASLSRGEIVALRGIGGYQLLCDGTNAEAVARLRQRKRRATKPLAVLISDGSRAAALGRMDGTERSLLAGAWNPIVIVRAEASSPLAADVVHPGLNFVGIMLPSSSLHWLIARDFGKPIVCTSGNREGEPLVFEPRQAERDLAGMADLWLHHDRDIVHPIDDSVVRCMDGRAVTLRLGRGLGPQWLDIGPDHPPALAVGGHQKAAVAWHNGEQAVLGPHIGDLDSIPALERFQSRIDAWRELYRFEPERVFHDAHPDYASTRYVSNFRCETVPIQHHHAHVAAAMIDGGVGDREVLGVAWDGTGWGLDGTIWGGEFLRATLRGFERVARLRPFRLPGGEAAIRAPGRVAASLAFEAGNGDVDALAMPGLRGAARLFQPLVDRPHLSPWTSSVGRLFDGIAWILLGDSVVGFDGRPAMMLECLADPSERGCYPLPIARGGPLWELDWRPMVRAILDDHARGRTPGAIAMRFHRALARGIVRMARHFRELPVVLGGGVFQNRVLVELVAEEWGQEPLHADRSQLLVCPGKIPPNDGGLAAGQLAIGLTRLACAARKDGGG